MTLLEIFIGGVTASILSGICVWLIHGQFQMSNARLEAEAESQRREKEYQDFLHRRPGA